MTSTLIAFLIICLVVASLKMAWFNTLLPVHVYHFLHKLGFNLGIDNWDNFPEYESTFEDWEFKVTTSRYPLLANLLTCPICLSFHISLWVSTLTYLVSLIVTKEVTWLIIPISTFTVPYIVNKILK